LILASDNLAAVTAPDGRIYLIGGTVGGSEVADVWAFTPSTGNYVKVASLAAPRANLGAALGADGSLYAVGGSAGANALRDVEAYGPQVTLSPSMVSASTAVSVSGSNFAALAPVGVYAGTDSSGAPLVNATTDGNGAFGPLTLPPFAGAGTFTLTIVDGHSRYPVQVAVSVGP
jgi:hypothetical protein